MEPPNRCGPDKRVRLAVSYALDRQAINEVGMPRFLSASWGHVPRVMEYALPAEPLPYNLRKPRQLLAEAGYPMV